MVGSMSNQSSPTYTASQGITLDHAIPYISPTVDAVDLVPVVSEDETENELPCSGWVVQVQVQEYVEDLQEEQMDIKAITDCLEEVEEQKIVLETDVAKEEEEIGWEVQVQEDVDLYLVQEDQMGIKAITDQDCLEEVEEQKIVLEIDGAKEDEEMDQPSRYRKTTLKDREALLDNLDSKNTKRNTAYAVKLFKGKKMKLDFSFFSYSP